MSSAINVTAIEYPESDGKPMGESDDHRDAMIRHLELLKSHFAGQQVYVSGDLLVFYEQGNPKKFVVPDAFMVKGIEPKKRRNYKIWIEGKVPNVAIETTSRKTRRHDMVTKPKLYARLGIREYFLFDPLQEYLDPPLQGHRLRGKSYVRIKPDRNGSLWSEELDLRLVVEHGELQFYTAGKRLLTHEEARRAAEQLVARLAEVRKAEAKARRAARQAEEKAQKSRGGTGRA
jgi:Uma2 family endonuclease